METITIQDTTVRAVSPEGQAAAMSVKELVRKLAPRRQDTGDVILPDGVVSVQSQGPVTIYVHQTSPRFYSFKWIAEGSRAPFGRGTNYRTVKLALPYLITVAVFASGPDDMPLLTSANECFFRNHPLKSLDDELYCPALLNCSRFLQPEGKPLAWICTQHLDDTPLLREPDAGKRVRASLKALLHCLLETGFNHSSEHHEGSSWYSESRGVDPRLATVEQWQKASEREPQFVLEVPWLKTGHTLRQLAKRIFKILDPGQGPGVATAADVARIVFNHKRA